MVAVNRLVMSGEEQEFKPAEDCRIKRGYRDITIAIQFSGLRAQTNKSALLGFMGASDLLTTSVVRDAQSFQA
jgi:hypothetical protein